MTVPQDYVYASRDFDRFMDELIAVSGHATRHQAFAVLRGVLHTFRRHLEIEDALRFADILPAVLRAIFVESWHPEASPPAFPDRAALTAEVKSVRLHHNLASEDSIRHVALALRNTLDPRLIDHVLEPMPPGARDFWAT